MTTLHDFFKMSWDGLGTLSLGSHNFPVTALGSCVKWPIKTTRLLVAPNDPSTTLTIKLIRIRETHVGHESHHMDRLTTITKSPSKKKSSLIDVCRNIVNDAICISGVLIMTYMCAILCHSSHSMSP